MSHAKLLVDAMVPVIELRNQRAALQAAINQSALLLAERRAERRLAVADDEELVEDTGSSALTEERARVAAGPAGKLLLTFVNRIRLDFATTWVSHVRRLKMTNWLVGATDVKALRSLRRSGVPCFSMRTRLPEGEWDWGSPSFKALGQHKVELIHRALRWGLEVVITDVDALVLREPFAYMARWPDAGFLTTSDHLSNTSGAADGGLEDRSATGPGSAFNIGFMMFRKSAMPLVEEWRRRLRQDPNGRWDQGEFGTLVRRGGLRFSPPPAAAAATAGTAAAAAATAAAPSRGLFWGYGGTVAGGVLPAALFCGGHHFFVSQLAQRSGWPPYSIHTTFQYGGAPGKRHRLREAMVWEDPPEYYDPPGGLLTFEPDAPARLVAPPGGMSTEGHAALMRHQLRAIRGALALASTLGRRLVLPPLTCGLDKYWAPLSDAGVIPGAPRWAVPIARCPLDHLLNPAELRPSADAHVREFSLLANPRLPAAMRAAAAAPHATPLQPRGGAAELARLRAVTARVLHVPNLAATATADDAWSRAGGGGGGLLTAAEWAAFERRFASLQGGWCCAPPRDRRRGMPHNVGFHILRV